MARGRPRNPNFGGSAPVGRKGIPACPDYLNAPARAKWKDLVRELKAMGVATKTDADTMARYCVTFVTWAKANDLIQKTGEVLKGPNGGMVQNPWLSVRNKADNQLAKISVQLGLDPLSRLRLRTNAPAAKSGKSKFFQAREGDTRGTKGEDPQEDDWCG